MLNLMGISYGVWNDSVDLDFSISTGHMNPEFYIDGSSSISDLNLLLSGDNSTLYIEGEVYPGFNEKINVEIINNGSIPVVLNQDIVDVNETIDVNIPIAIPNREIDLHNIRMQPYDGSSIPIMSPQDIYELIDELDVVEYYTFKKELEFKQKD